MANIFENKSHKCLPKLAILIPKIKDSGITVNSCAETSLNTIFQSILELSQNLFVVGIEGSIVNARENKQDMIASCFHLKGNLFSFNSHKTSIIFFFSHMGDSSLTALCWVTWTPQQCWGAIGAREKGQEQGLKDGAHQQQSREKKEEEVLAEEQEPQFLPQLPANIWRKD